MTTTYTSEQIIDLLFTNSGKFVSLHTGNPGATGANELTTGVDANYVRKAVTLVKSATGSVYQAKNNAAVAFAAAAVGASYTVTHVCIWSASTAGNCLAVLPLAVPLPTVAGTINTFATGDLTVVGD